MLAKCGKKENVAGFMVAKQVEVGLKHTFFDHANIKILCSNRDTKLAAGYSDWNSEGDIGARDTKWELLVQR